MPNTKKRNNTVEQWLITHANCQGMKRALKKAPRHEPSVFVKHPKKPKLKCLKWPFYHPHLSWVWSRSPVLWCPGGPGWERTADQTGRPKTRWTSVSWSPLRLCSDKADQGALGTDSETDGEVMLLQDQGGETQLRICDVNIYKTAHLRDEALWDWNNN